MTLTRRPPYMGRLRPWLQRGFSALEGLQRDTLTIRVGDPLAAEFAAFGDGSWIEWPHLFLGNPSTVVIESDVEIQSHVSMEVHSPPGTVALRFCDAVRVGHYVSGDGLEVLELKRHCAEHVPRYMVPETIVVEPTLPRTSTGKVDRQSLSQRAAEPSSAAG